MIRGKYNKNLAYCIIGCWRSFQFLCLATAGRRKQHPRSESRRREPAPRIPLWNPFRSLSHGLWSHPKHPRYRYKVLTYQLSLSLFICFLNLCFWINICFCSCWQWWPHQVVWDGQHPSSAPVGSAHSEQILAGLQQIDHNKQTL